MFSVREHRWESRPEQQISEARTIEKEHSVTEDQCRADAFPAQALERTFKLIWRARCCDLKLDAERGRFTPSPAQHLCMQVIVGVREDAHPRGSRHSVC